MAYVDGRWWFCYQRWLVIGLCLKRQTYISRSTLRKEKYSLMVSTQKYIHSVNPRQMLVLSYFGWNMRPSHCNRLVLINTLLGMTSLSSVIDDIPNFCRVMISWHYVRGIRNTKRINTETIELGGIQELAVVMRLYF